MNVANNLSRKKIVQLENVLRNYSIESKGIVPVRSAFRIETNNDVKCLKEFKHHPEKTKVVYAIIQHLKEHGFTNTPNLILTKNHDLFIKDESKYYYLTDWVEGRESNFDSYTELLAAVNLLALFHKSTRGFKPPEYGRFIKQYHDWLKIHEKKNNQLIEFKKLQTKNLEIIPFHNLYVKQIDLFIKLGDLSLDIIKHANYQYYATKAEQEGCVCHDSFYYQNVMVDSKNKMYIIDLDSCIGDIPLYDLGKLLRRTLDKSNYQWSISITKDIISTYMDIHPLDKNEKLLLLAVIIFPHKFWKLGIKRFLKNKEWSKEKYERKLKTQIKQNEMIVKFINNYLDLFEIDYEININ